MKIDLLRSFLAQHLPVKLYAASNGPLRRWIWRRLHHYYNAGRLPVRTRLHGRPIMLNAANPYPFILADAPHFNSGLVAAAASLHRHLNRPLRIVDVGAAIGDTVALLDNRLLQGIASYLCIEGAVENQPYFEFNTAGIAEVSVHFIMLSAKAGDIPSLVRHHPGTAMAAGRGFVQSQTLDELLVGCGVAGNCDLLKIDVDGYDGEVLLGASKTLSKLQPLVVFEWHPYLLHLCGNDHRAPFHALAAAGYRKLLWFGNRGPFSHASEIPTDAECDWWHDFLIEKNQPMGPHFDIVALPPAFECVATDIARAAIYPG